MGERIEALQQAPRRDPRGRPARTGTILASIMSARLFRNNVIAVAMNVSDRALSNYLARRAPVPAQSLVGLCDFLEMDPEELVDDNRFLLPDSGHSDKEN